MIDASVSFAISGFLGGAFAAYLFVLVPFSLAMGLHLGLHGASFGALCRTILVGTAVALLVAAIVVATSWPAANPNAPLGAALAFAVPRRFLWGPELVLAMALAAHGYLHRHEPARPSPIWIAGPALGVSVETLVWWRMLSVPLESTNTAGVADLVGLLAAGFSGAAVLSSPGWLLGRMIHHGTTPGGHIAQRIMRNAWAVWPAWMVLALAARWL